MSLKLKHLLNELTAAEKAHQLGYTSAGYDKWEKDGKVVARTVNGELVPISKDQSGPSPDTKPTTMSAKDAGTQPSNTVHPTDAKKMAGNSSSQDKKKEGSDEEVPHAAPRNPFGLKPFPVGRPVEDYELEKELAPGWDSEKLTKEFTADEEPYLVSEQEWDAYFLCHPGTSGIKDRDVVKKIGREAALRQYANWRKTLDPVIQGELGDIQYKWQEDDQYIQRDKEERNAKINLIANGRPPAILENMEFPIERGMRLSPKDFEQFIKTFTVGELWETPPSGFSMNPLTARSYADPIVNKVGIHLRLSPNRKGQIHGIALSGVNEVPPNMKASPFDFMSQVAVFQHEMEVIRPAGVKARCVSIRKLIRVPDPNSLLQAVKVCYVIDLEDMGTETGLEEARTPKKKKDINPVFERIMNTSFGYWNPKKQASASLTEGKASDMAHKLGLVYKGHGYWGDKTGKTVAKTVNDTLVKASNDDHQHNKYMHPNDGLETEPFAYSADTSKNFEPYTPEESTTELPSDVIPTKGHAQNIMGGQKIGAQAGSNPGGEYIGKDGIKRYVKHYDDPAQAQCEVLANCLYHDLGIDVPESQYFDSGMGKTSFASVMVPNIGTLGGQGVAPDVAMRLMQGYAADCLIGNWDVIGLAQDNIVLSADYKPIRIDNGGSFLMRAMGGRKEDKFLNTCTEIMKFPVSQYAPIFATLQVKEPVKYLKEELRPQVENILDMVTKVGGWENYVQKKVPDMDPQDKQKIIAMLYHRTKALIDFVEKP